MKEYFYDPLDCEHSESGWICYLGHLPTMKKLLMACMACGSVFVTEIEEFVVAPEDWK